MTEHKKFEFDKTKLNDISNIYTQIEITSGAMVEVLQYIVIKEFMDKEFPGLSVSDIKTIIYEHSPERLV